MIKADQAYIKTIFKITDERGVEWASTSAIAECLGISRASVTGMLKRLAARKPPLLEHKPYGGARLTADGRVTAKQLIRSETLLESFLRQALEFPERDIPSELERLEYVVSDLFTERLAAFFQAIDRSPSKRDKPINKISDRRGTSNG